jgi:hypothetical protein
MLAWMRGSIVFSVAAAPLVRVFARDGPVGDAEQCRLHRRGYCKRQRTEQYSHSTYR